MNRLRMAAGRFVNVLVPVPFLPPVFSASAVTVIGPYGTPVKPKSENCRVVPVPVRATVEVKTGAVDCSGGRSHSIRIVATGSRPSPRAVPVTSSVDMSNSEPFAGDVI